MKIVVTIAAALVAVTLAPSSAHADTPSLHESFSLVADGPAPSFAGTLPVTNYQSSPGATPHVRAGYLTTANPDEALGGSYRIANLGSDVTRVGASFAFTPHTARGGVLCLSIQAESIAVGDPVPLSPAHFVIGATGWSLDVNAEAGTGVDVLVGGKFDTPLASDGVTLHRIDVELDRAASKLRLTLPDGSRRTFTNAAFGLAGQHVYVEPFKSPQGGPLANQANALVSEWWADTAPVVVDESGEAVAIEDATPAVVAEVEAPAAPVAIPAPQPEPTVVEVVDAPEKPRGVRAVRKGARVVTTWRATGSDVRVKCGRVSKVVDGRKAWMRSAASRCKVRAVSPAGSSPWAVVSVR